MATSVSSDNRIFRIWVCPLHQKCYTTNHVTIDVIKEQAARCPHACVCWRHAVIRVAGRGGIR